MVPGGVLESSGIAQSLVLEFVPRRPGRSCWASESVSECDSGYCEWQRERGITESASVDVVEAGERLVVGVRAQRH